MSELETKIQYFREKQKEMLELDRTLQNKKQEYLAEMKAAFGIADGEPANVLEIVEAIKKVKDMV
jgi:hypothetical protein